ncbi:hypothetical protein L218DRAFT_1077845 [Marasmius fiardii PR-910]|nr:hypothetical protein L218DRAFT_1077845 [Marasmius fiardii PR-910]
MSFTGSSNFRVVDSAVSYTRGDNNTTNINYYQDFSRIGSGLPTLSTHAAFRALHDSEARYPQPNVLPGTRMEILQRLCRWIEDSGRTNRVYWVNGAAGVGKSAIAQTLSEKYIQTGQLAAAFFFSRNDPTRDKLDPFVITLVYQLATSSTLQPLIAPLIDHVIRSTPGILDKNWEKQFRMLIEEPCAQVDPSQWRQLPRLIIIDGVDECIDVDSQKRLLQIIQHATPTLPLDFLLFSRPEPHIRHMFCHQYFVPTPINLSLGDYAVWDDIRKYLCREFSRIQEEHWHVLPSPQALWPGDSVINQLLRKATGQFIYVTTVMKYIDKGRAPVTPGQRLEVILRSERVVKSSSPYPDLDQLYTQILQFCVNEGGKLQKVLRLIVNTQFNQQHIPMTPFRLRGSILPGLQSLWALEQLLNLQQGEAAALLSGLHSVLHITPSVTENITVFHASFTEFLLDQDRAGVYYAGTKLDFPEWRQLVFSSQLRMLTQLCVESDRAAVHSDVQVPVANGIHDIDIGSLSVWEYFYQNRNVIAIDDEVAAALNMFDPYLYLSALLRWNCRLLTVVPFASLSLGYRRAPLTFEVSRFLLRRSESRDWRYHTIAVGYQTSMLYSVFQTLKSSKKSSTRRRLQIFFKQCNSFFSGFYVSFPIDQSKQSIRNTLLACQFSISRLHRQFPDGTAVSCFEHLEPISGDHNVELRIIPLESYDGQHPMAAPARSWEVKFIRPVEGWFLRKLLELLIDKRSGSESEVNRRVARVLAGSEIEEWILKLAQLDRGKTWKMYLLGKLVQKPQPGL